MFLRRRVQLALPAFPKGPQAVLAGAYLRKGDPFAELLTQHVFQARSVLGHIKHILRTAQNS
jgi:hypothetical protein